MHVCMQPQLSYTQGEILQASGDTSCSFPLRIKAPSQSTCVPELVP